MTNRLNIVQVSSQSPTPKPNESTKASRRSGYEAKFERLWLQNPEQFEPLQSALETERITCTCDLIDRTLDVKDKSAADIGCGTTDRSPSNE